jgi:hypothetical protein
LLIGRMLRAAAARFTPFSAGAAPVQASDKSCPRFNEMDAPLLYGINRARVEVMN